MGKLAFITGATAGIGRATAEKFAREGYDLVITGRRSERLEKLRQSLEQNDISVQTLVFDIREQQATRDAWESLDEKWQQVDLLVNNAGLALGKSSMQEGDVADWEQMIDTNVKGLLYMTRLIVPEMINRQSGHIINISSLAAHEVYPGGGVYCANKHAVDAITKGLRQDLIHDGIRVTAISPGLVETEFSVVRFKGDQQKADKVYQGFEPLTARDIADTIWFAANAPAHVTIAEMLILARSQADSRLVSKKLKY